MANFHLYAWLTFIILDHRIIVLDCRIIWRSSKLWPTYRVAALTSALECFKIVLNSANPILNSWSFPVNLVFFRCTDLGESSPFYLVVQVRNLGLTSCSPSPSSYLFYHQSICLYLLTIFWSHSLLSVYLLPMWSKSELFYANERTTWGAW